MLLPWLFGSQAPTNADRIQALASPNAFNLLDWETRQLGADFGPLINGLTQTRDPTASDRDTLRAYFEDKARRDELRIAAQAAIERAITSAYTQDGLRQAQPVAVPGLFPPVMATLTRPPNVLVIAPRTALRVIHSSVLQPMDVAAQEGLEASADSNGVSSLVAPIGGIATYPSMVLEDDSPQRVFASVAHEWMHQYLIFYPLGTGYWGSQQTREINETAAEMIGQEVGTQIASSLDLASARTPANRGRPAAQFDFTRYMRDTRARTEALLTAGKVDEAEAYMRARRDELQQHGYYIRKLNQAYFALYGSYGEGFAASPSSPIPSLLHKLRNSSGSLGEFVVSIRGITTVEQLRQAAG